MKIHFSTVPTAMIFCGFCGKGPFPATSALNKHIRNSVKCNETERQKWSTYAKDRWKNAPGPTDIDQHQPVSPTVPDIAFEDDLQGLEDDLEEFRGAEADAQAVDEILPEPLTRPVLTVENSDDRSKDLESTFFVEEFPAQSGAGAVWGEDVPLFERLWQEQVDEGSSRWTPFDDQDEWELAMWLIRNVGHNQITAFLNLNVVGS